MERNRSQKIKSAVVLICLIGLSSTTAKAASQSDSGWFIYPSSGIVTSSSNFTPSSVMNPKVSASTNSTSGTPIVALAVVPSCTTQAMNPHPSTHVPGTINAEVRQVCNTFVQSNSVEALLWERRWWGYNVIDGPRFSSLNYTNTQSVFVNTSCRSNYIRVTGYGHYLYLGTEITSPEVSNTQYVSC